MATNNTSDRVLVRKPVTPQPFRFLDLPAEIRNRIYSLCVVEPKPILAFDGWPASHTSYPPLSDYTLRYLFRQERFTITQVNRQISAEAASILYGYNTLEFNSTRDLGRFLTDRPTARKHLRQVNIIAKYSWGRDSVESLTRDLGMATNLQSITLDHKGFWVNALSDGNRIQIGEFVEKVVPFLRDWQIQNSDRNVLNVIKLAGFEWCDTCCGTVPKCSCHDAEGSRCGRKHFARVEEALRKQIAKKVMVKTCGSSKCTRKSKVAG